ncbi:hypothetical protein Efla_007102 [Eimeria flavescens]
MVNGNYLAGERALLSSTAGQRVRPPQAMSRFAFVALLGSSVYPLVIVYSGVHWGPLEGPLPSMWRRPLLFAAFTVSCSALLASLPLSLANGVALKLPSQGQSLQGEDERPAGSSASKEEKEEQEADRAAISEKPIRLNRQTTGSLQNGRPSFAMGAEKSAGNNSPGGEDAEASEADELEVVRQIRLAREQQETQEEWNPSATIRLSAHAVMWLALAAVVYIVVHGATRQGEKQMSLKAHTAALKKTVDSLVNKKKRKRQLQQEREAIMCARTALLLDFLDVSAELEAVVQDIQQTATLIAEEEETNAEVVLGRPGGIEFGAAPGPSLTVPGIERGSREVNFELQDLLLHQGDSPYQEEAVRQHVLRLLRSYGVPRGTFERKEHQRFQSDEKMDGIDKWFLSAASDLGVGLEAKTPAAEAEEKQEEEAAAEGASKTPEQRRRDRQLGLLGLTTVMLRRKAGLESYLRQLQSELERHPVFPHHMLASVQDVRSAIRRRVEGFRESLEGPLFQMMSAFDAYDPDDQRVLEASRQVAQATWKALSAVDADERLTEECDEDPLAVAQAAAAARMQLILLVQKHTKLLNEKLLRLANEGQEADNKRKVDAVKGLLGTTDTGARLLIDALASLRFLIVEVDATQKQNAIVVAGLKERQHKLTRELEETNQWIDTAVKVFTGL